jgi:hypothetical protein
MRIRWSHTLLPTLALAMIFVGTVTLAPVHAVNASVVQSVRSCDVLSILRSFVRYTYTVQIQRGNVPCGEARTVLYRSVEGPPFRSPGWQCQVGEARGSWAISCTGRGSVIRAYGPIAHTGTWAQAAAQAGIRVEIPRTTLGLSLTNAVGAKRCGGGKGPSWVYATYGRTDGASLTVAEGRPYNCGQLGVPALVAVWNIRGHAARLSEYCGPTGCARISGQWGLDWMERGMEITLITRRLDQHELLAIARSLTSLPD